MSTHGLTFGSIDLASGLAEAGGYWFEVLADGFAPGSPQAVKAVIATLMRDGEDERIARYGNRTFTFRVAVRAPDSDALHAGEAALVAELGGRNTISWSPPDGYGGETVFDVLNSTMDPEFDDMALLRSPLEMVYAITATCEPWPRSSALTTTPFTPGTPAPTTVDDGSALTNWSLRTSGALSTATWLGEAAIFNNAADSTTVVVRWSGAVPVENFVAFDLGAAANSALTAVRLNDVYPVALEYRASGYIRYYFTAPAAGPLDLAVDSASYTPTGGGDFYIGGLYSMASVPSEGVLVAAVGGSMPSPGALSISRAATDLADLLVYSDPAMLTHGYSPSVEATWEFAPEGRYLVYLDNTDAGAVFDQVVTVSAQNAAGTFQTVRTRYNTDGRWIPVGELQLGGNRDGLVGAMTWTATVAGVSVTTPQFRLFRMDTDTALIYAAPETGSGVLEVIVDIPSVDYPHGGVWFNGADGLDFVDAWDFPLMVPPATALFVADNHSGSGAPLTVTLSAYERWHTFAASEAS